MPTEEVLRSSGRQVSFHLGLEAATAGAATVEAIIMAPSIADQIMATLVAAATMVGIAAEVRAAIPTAMQAPPARSPTPSRCPNHHQQHSATAAIVAKVQADSVRRNREASQYPGQVQRADGVALIAFVATVVAMVAVATEGQQTEV